jgi:tetratricopeptide (TPR) repeat protein
MKHSVQNNVRFISDLAELSLRGFRELHSASAKIGAKVASASVIDAAMSFSRARLNALMDLGEKAHALRDRDTLLRVGKAIRSLPLGALSDSIGNYYIGLSLCRKGRDAYPEANNIFLAAAEKAPKLFRAKAWGAVAANLATSGDLAGGRSAHDEARKIAEGCERGALRPLFWAAITRSLIKISDGDHRGAIEDLRRLAPLASIVGVEQPPLLYIFKNNLAIELAETGAMQEAVFLANELRTSPFAHLYPEWLRTSDDIAWKARRPSRDKIFISEQSSSAVDESEAAEAAETREEPRLAAEAAISHGQVALSAGDRAEAEPAGVPVSSAEPAVSKATVAAVLVSFSRITIQPTFPSTITRGIEDPWPAHPQFRSPGQGYAQFPPARGPPVS